MAEFIIAVDDTDTAEQGGTGRLCRGLAEALANCCEVRGVTRHQLAILPEIPYTRKNSANAIHLIRLQVRSDELLDYATEWVAEHCCPGSNPGLCQGTAEALTAVSLGRAAQRRVVTMQEARQAADAAGVVLRSVAGDGHGIIGALAAAALASSGNDGRFVEVGQVRALQGPVSIPQAQDAGIAEVREASGQPVTEGEIIATNGLRPALCEGKCVLFVIREGSHWIPVRGWPAAEQGEVQPQAGTHDI